MMFIKPLSVIPNKLHRTFKEWSPTKKLVLTAILASISAILQSAGGLIPGVGFLISPFSTITIILAIMISNKHGIFAYTLAIILLILIEPSELFIFPFTTGLLGLGVGWALRTFQSRLLIILTNSIILFIGICIPLYGLGFQVFGLIIPSIPNIRYLVAILGFSILYSWLWLEIGLYFITKINKILLK